MATEIRPPQPSPTPLPSFGSTPRPAPMPDPPDADDASPPLLNDGELLPDDRGPLENEQPAQMPNIYPSPR